MLVQKVCPKCGGKKIMGFIARPCFVSVKFDTSTNKDVFELIEEDNTPSRIQYDTIKCAECGEKVKPNVLKINMVKCSKCGKDVPASYVNDEGICYSCIAMDNAPDIANASREELLMMLIQSRMNTETVNAQPETVQNTDNDQPVENENTETNGDEETQKKRRVRRKSAKAENDNVNENNNQVAAETTQENETDIGMNPPEEPSSDEAPFPDVTE
jgi:hypothetical protein